MRDQDVDRECIGPEGDERRPMTLRWGSTPREACSHEPLEVLLRQEEPELAWLDDDTWWDTVVAEDPRPRTHAVPSDEAADELEPLDAVLHLVSP